MVTRLVSQIHIVETCCKKFNTSDWLRYLSSLSDLSDMKSLIMIPSRHRPPTKSSQSPMSLDGCSSWCQERPFDWMVWSVFPPAVTRSPSPSTSLLVPRKSLSGNAVIWSSKCMANPCPFSARYVLSHRWFPVVFHRLVLLIVTGQYIPRIIRRHLLI